MILRNLLLFALYLFPEHAFACFPVQHLKIENVRTADIVVKAEVIAYEKVGFGEQRPSEHYGLLRLRTIETWKGEERGEWEFSLWSSTFGVPDEWSSKVPLVVAGIWAHTFEQRSGTPIPNAAVRRDIPIVLEEGCSGPFIFHTDKMKGNFEMRDRYIEMIKKNPGNVDISKVESAIRGMHDLFGVTLSELRAYVAE